MQNLLSYLNSGFDLLTVVLGFSLIIVLHELGHFLAAKWAGVRTLAFAVGFGPSLVSYRKGLGWRRGSSEAEYNRLQKSAAGAGRGPGAVASTEYRLNALPFGGYVKMLGQEDVNPGARSDEPDSYQNVPVWKRMVIISAGVVTNVVVAAALFVVVFLVGLKTEPPKVGLVLPGTPAAKAVASNAADLGIAEPGLRPGDLVIGIDGRKPDQFSDLMVSAAMASPGEALVLDVRRPGVEGVLRFAIKPERDPATKMLFLGVGSPASSTRLREGENAAARDELLGALARCGLAGVEPGMRLISADGAALHTPYQLGPIIEASEGRPVTLVFRAEPGAGSAGTAREVSVVVTPEREFSTTLFKVAGGAWPLEHLLGLAPAMAVETVGEKGEASGLRPGDVFVQIGALEWPSIVDGVAEIRSHKGGHVDIVVLREEPGGGSREVALPRVSVSSEGTIGFGPGMPEGAALLAAWPRLPPVEPGAAPSGAGLAIPAGSRITAVNGAPVTGFAGVHRAVMAAVGAAPEAGRHGAEVALTVALPGSAAAGATEVVRWSLSAEDVKELRSHRWTADLLAAGGLLFESETFLMKSETPAGALAMGLRETRRVMATTYLTFARLFQGSVKVQHLKGPVGIAHTGTLLAERGPIWLLFFMALVSVNLAVVNFLPIPIADGGHMVFLVYEQVTGRPPSVGVINAATLVGLIGLVSMFLIVTFHDIRNLFL